MASSSVFKKDRNFLLSLQRFTGEAPIAGLAKSAVYRKGTAPPDGDAPDRAIRKWFVAACVTTLQDGRTLPTSFSLASRIILQVTGNSGISSVDPMALASNDPETDLWIQQYRARNAARNGQGMINGVPVQQALGMTPAEVVAANPVLPAPGVAAVTPAQQDKAMRTAEVLGAARAEQQQGEKNASRDRYAQFLMDQGIDPDTIGSARLSGTMGDRKLNVTPIAQEELAVNSANFDNALEGRGRIAARRAFQEGDAMAWAEGMNMVGMRNRNIPGGGRNSTLNRDYWLQRLNGAFDRRNNIFGQTTPQPSANGYSTWW